jgi:hypothetical protein
MRVPDYIECPGCGNPVKPLRRKAPKVSRADLENVNPTMDFGWFCPVEECKVRLDKAIAALQSEAVTVDESNAIDPTDIPEDILPRSEEPAIKLQPRKVLQIRPTPSKDLEDIFVRIPREHAEALREEAELKTRLADVVVRREKLDRLMAAITDLQQPIAAE